MIYKRVGGGGRGGRERWPKITVRDRRAAGGGGEKGVYLLLNYGPAHRSLFKIQFGPEPILLTLSPFDSASARYPAARSLSTGRRYYY